MTGHRWCRRCGVPAAVAVDELTASVAVRCPRCGRAPEGPATRQIERTCRASMLRCGRMAGLREVHHLPVVA